MDGEDDAVAKAVVALALIVVDDQASVGQGLALVVRYDLLQRLPIVRCVAQAEACSDLARQAALLQVVDGAARGTQLFAVEARSQAHGLVQAFAAVVLRSAAVAAVVGYLQASPVRQFLHRVDKAKPAVFHEEADRAAVHAATEAVIELLGGADRE